MFLTLFFVYYFFLDWLRLNCMEVLDYVTEKLCTLRIKINKERGGVYNDFDFDLTELLSECSSNIGTPNIR